MRNYLFLLFAFICFSCKKPEKTVAPVPNFKVQGTIAYVLNEGLYNANNATITAYATDSGNVIQNYFRQKNGRNLGDTGNDIAAYGSKIYILLPSSSIVEIVDKYTFKSLKQIPFISDSSGAASQPQNIIFSGSNAFVSAFDGKVVVIDTTSLSIIKKIQVGRNPDRMAIQYNKLYVSNSGALDANNYGTTVSVIDLNTLSEIKKIDVGVNPGGLIADKYGEVYVITRGNYSDVPSRLHIIDASTDTVKKTFPFEASEMAVKGDSALISFYDYNTMQSSIRLLNLFTEQIASSNFIDVSLFQTLYGFAFDPFSGNLYVGDAMGYSSIGKVLVFNAAGSKIGAFQAGLNPGHFCFIKGK